MTLTAIILTLVMTIFPSDVESLINSDSKVIDAECLVVGDMVVIAVKTEPLFFRSDRIRLIEKLKSDVKSRYDVSEVMITFDRDIYYKISKIDMLIAEGLTEEQLRSDIIALVETVKSREL
ncbi:MAG: YhcN/YlaJ family sporulation lipoprotein [Christensenellales bacterium]|jgi:hypothetical protein